jgi:hypothetical protein
MDLPVKILIGIEDISCVMPFLLKSFNLGLVTATVDNKTAISSEQSSKAAKLLAGKSEHEQ